MYKLQKFQVSYVYLISSLKWKSLRLKFSEYTCHHKNQARIIYMMDTVYVFLVILVVYKFL